MAQISTTIRQMVFAVSRGLIPAIAICLGLVLAPAVGAQVLYGTLIGTVQDTSSALIANAQITATEASTGVTQTATSDSDGIYRFTTLLPGTYKVSISASGFSKQETQGVIITA